jgi:hypothetical protein
MTLPAIPVTPGTRATAVVTRPLTFNRHVGHASERQATRQALGADVEVTLTAPGRRPTTTTGTLDEDGHVGVVSGLVVSLLGASWEVTDGAAPVGRSDDAMHQRLIWLGYMPVAYTGSEGLPSASTVGVAALFQRIVRRMVYDFQGDHGIVATGELDGPTRDAIVAAFGE